jgi:hypothetical protein
MTKRYLLVTILILMISLVVFIPQHPAVRGWLLERLQSVVLEAGYDLQVQRVSGNPWFGLSVEGLRLEGDGVALAADRAQVRYTLPALIVGRLPLSVRAGRVAGSIDFAAVALPEGDGRPAAVQLALRELTLEDVDVAAVNVPFTLPDIRLRGLRVTTDHQGIAFASEVVTPEGTLEANGALQLAPFVLEADITRADVRIARQWWDGITGGVVTGRVRVAEGQVSAVAEVENGSIRFLDEEVTGISGQASYTHPNVQARLSGRVLGGEVVADGGVAIDKQRWFGEAEGLVDLKAVSTWLMANRVPFDPEVVPLVGQAEVTVQASGWQGAVVRGRGQGAGTLAGYPLEQLLAEFTVDTEVGVSVSSSTRLADGLVTAELTPVSEGFQLALAADGVMLTSQLAAGGAFNLTALAGELAGVGDLRVAGELFEDPVAVDVALTLQDGDWRALLGGVALAGAFSGDAHLIDGVLAAQLGLAEARLPPLASPLQLSLRAEGPLDALPLTLQLDAPESLSVALPGVDAATDLRGEVRATLRGTDLQDIAVALGNVRASGELALAPLAGELAVALSQTPLSGALTGDAALSEGRLELDGSVVQLTGEVVIQSLGVPGVRLPDLTAALALVWQDATPSLTLSDPVQGVALSYSDNTLVAQFGAVALELAGQQVLLTGTASLDSSAALTSLMVDTQLDAELFTGVLTGEAGQLSAQLRPTLAPESTLTGELDVTSGALRVAGALAELTVTGDGQLFAAPGAPQVTVQLQDDRDQLTLRYQEGELALTGGLDIAALAPLLPLDVSGRVTADIVWSDGGYGGGASAQGAVVGVPFNLQLTGLGDVLALAGTAQPVGIPIGLSGQLAPQLEVQVTSDYGALNLSGATVSGSGVIPEAAFAGFEVTAQPWQLTGDLNAQRMRLQAGASSVTLDWREGWQLTADINQLAQGEVAQLELTATAQLSDQQPEGSVAGTLTLVTADDEAQFTVAGALNDLRLAGLIEAATVTEALALPVAALGVIDVSVLWQDGTLNAEAAWQTAVDTVQLSLRSTPTALVTNGARLAVTGDTLEGVLSPSGFSLTADGFAPGAFIDVANLPEAVSGSLSFTEPDGWQGLLEVRQVGIATPLQLIGQQGALDVLGAVQLGPLALSASGTLLPETSVELRAEVPELAAFAGEITGPPQALTLAGTLATEAITLETPVALAAPAQQFAVAGSLADGLSVALTAATGEAVRLQGGTLFGSLAIPLMVDAVPHTLTLSPVGNVSAPQLGGTLVGPYASGELHYSDARLMAELTVDANPLIELPLGASLAPIHVSAVADAALAWQLTAEGALVRGGEAVSVQAQLHGQAADFDGDIRAFVAGEQLLARISAQQGVVALSAQPEHFELASLQGLLDLSLSGVVSGELSWSTAAGLAIDLAAQGSAFERPFDVALRQSQTTPLSFTGEVDAVTVNLVQQTAARYRLTLAAEWLQDAVFELSLDERWELSGGGRLLSAAGDLPLQLAGAFTPETAQGSLTLSYDEAQLLLTVWQPNERWEVAGALQLPAETPLPVTGDGQFQASLQAGALELSQLTFEGAAGDSSLSVALSGEALPDTRLQGELITDVVGPVQLSLTRQPEALRFDLALVRDGLTLRATLAEGLEFLSLTGTGALPLGAGVTVDSALYWSLREGFQGNAAIEAALTEAISLSAQLFGAQTLTLQAQLAWFEAQLGALWLELADEVFATGALAAPVRLWVTSEALAPPISATELTAELSLLGTLNDPQLSGALALSGGLVATGMLEAALTGASLQLEGDGMRLTGSATQTQWQAQLIASELSLAEFVPQLRQPRLRGVLSASQRWGAPLDLTAEAFRLELANSHAQADLRYRPEQEQGLRGRLAIELDASDLLVEATGRLSGQLTIDQPNGAPVVGGTLQASGLSLAGSGAQLGGSIIVTGELLRPSLTARLSGAGEASGTLLASYRAQDNALVASSDLQIGELMTNFSVAWEAGRLSTDGVLRFADYAFAFVPTVDNTVALQGQAQLADWQVTIDPSEQILRAVGELSSVQPSLAGSLSLRLDVRALTQPGRDWLTGRLTQGQLGGVALGDIALLGSASGNVALSGDALDASVTLAGAPRWELLRFEAPLTEAAVVRAVGEGGAQSGRLALELDAAVAGERLTLPLIAQFEGGRVQLESNSALLGGELALQATATAEAGWQGHVQVAGAELAGFVLSASGAFSGVLGQPQLDLSSELVQGETRLEGALRASLAEVATEQTLITPLLARPLTLTAQLLPTVELRLAVSPTNRFTLGLEGEQLVSAGNLRLQSSGVELRLSGESERLIDLELGYSALTGLTLGTALDAVTFDDLLAQLQQGGLTLVGREQTSGAVTVRVSDPLSVTVERLGYSAPQGVLELSASYDVGSATGNLSGSWRRANGDGPLPPWLRALERISFSAAANERFARLDAQAPAGQGQLTLTLNRRTLATELQARLSPESGQALIDLRFTPEQGISGLAEIRSLPLFAIDAEQIGRLSVTLQADESFVTADGALTLGEGRLTLAGSLNLANYLPEFFAPVAQGADGLRVSLQDTDLAAIPLLRRELPFLEGVFRGQLELAGGRLSGELASPTLRIAERELPLALSFAGTPSDLSIEGQLAQHRLSASYQEGRLSAFAELERFPIEALIEARLGAVDVRTEVTGAIRLELPAGGKEPFVRFASQMIVLERAGIRTEGQLSFVYEDGGLTIGEAIFEGDGRWQATGEISQTALNLRLNATDANFDPLLGLIPQLAAFDVGARGSVQVITTGTLAAPVIRATTPQLEVTVAGSRYRLTDTAFTVQDNQFVTSAQLSALAPLTGTLNLSGGGQFTLVPFRPNNIVLRFEGDTAVPVIGELTGLSGAITATAEAGWQLDASGVLGQPFTLQGDLNPLDLRLSGQRLNLRAPDFFLISSETDVNLRFVFDERFYLTGSLGARTAQLSLQREGPPQVAEPLTSAAAAERRRVLERIVFDGVTISAPQDIRFQENFGSGELALAATLRGNAAQPTLDGQASAVRGAIRFAGRDFTITQARAQFEATRGLFPTLDISAQTTFDAATIERDANRTRSDANRLTLLANGGAVAVTLSLQGEVIPTPNGERAFTVDIDSTLSSNATLQEVGSAPRPLTEPELFTLLTLGRLELNPQFTGDAGLGLAVAQGAIDTAIDLLILSELQQQIGQALGVDLFEIRTTPIGTLLTGGADTFGVSLRIGGYLSDEVFATYEIGSLSADRSVAFSNVFNVRYDLSPLEFQLVGRLDFLNDDRFTPITELSARVGYAFTPLIRLEGGVNLSNVAQGVRFGVSFRW